MTQKELEQKVIDAEGRVAKREAVLKKHNSQLAKMIEKGADRFDISIKREDIKSATSKLAEARETLANWQDKLNTRITRDAYLEANTPEILKDFLENWKQHAIGYYREKRIRFIEYRDGLKAKERAARLEALQTLPSLEKYRELYKGRKAAEAAGLPFCERLADGGDDELSPYVYDGSMALADREKMQQAREAFEKLADALREIAAKLVEALKPAINAVLSALKKLWKVSAKAIGVPPKWLHLAAHAKKARTRKKYRNRIRRYVFEALAAEGGGGP